MAEYMTTADVAGETGINAGTLRYWRSTNQGPPSFSLGKRVVYRRAELEKWIAEQEQATRRGGGEPPGLVAHPHAIGVSTSPAKHDLAAAVPKLGGTTARSNALTRSRIDPGGAA